MFSANQVTDMVATEILKVAHLLPHASDSAPMHVSKAMIRVTYTVEPLLKVTPTQYI